MKTKKLTPRNTAPVKRENVATVSTDASAIAALTMEYLSMHAPFASVN